MSWIGRVFDVTYGLNTGDYLKVVSEPRPVDRRGNTAVSVKDSNGNVYEIETEVLENSVYYTERENN